MNIDRGDQVPVVAPETIFLGDPGKDRSAGNKYKPGLNHCPAARRGPPKPRDHRIKPRTNSAGAARSESYLTIAPPMRRWVTRSMPPMQQTRLQPSSAAISSADQIWIVWP